jgi:hypothetical protein
MLNTVAAGNRAQRCQRFSFRTRLGERQRRAQANRRRHGLFDELLELLAPMLASMACDFTGARGRCDGQ